MQKSQKPKTDILAQRNISTFTHGLHRTSPLQKTASWLDTYRESIIGNHVHLKYRVEKLISTSASAPRTSDITMLRIAARDNWEIAISQAWAYEVGSRGSGNHMKSRLREIGVIQTYPPRRGWPRSLFRRRIPHFDIGGEGATLAQFLQRLIG